MWSTISAAHSAQCQRIRNRVQRRSTCCGVVLLRSRQDNRKQLVSNSESVWLQHLLSSYQILIFGKISVFCCCLFVLLGIIWFNGQSLITLSTRLFVFLSIVGCNNRSTEEKNPVERPIRTNTKQRTGKSNISFLFLFLSCCICFFFLLL